MFLARIIQLLDTFVRTDSNPTVDFHIQTIKAVIDTFASIKADLAKSRPDQADGYSDEEVNIINYVLTRVKFILKRFDLMINMYETL